MNNSYEEVLKRATIGPPAKRYYIVHIYKKCHSFLSLIKNNQDLILHVNYLLADVPCEMSKRVSPKNQDNMLAGLIRRTSKLSMGKLL